MDASKYVMSEAVPAMVVSSQATQYFTQLPGSLKQIAVGSYNVWSVTRRTRFTNLIGTADSSTKYAELRRKEGARFN